MYLIPGGIKYIVLRVTGHIVYYDLRVFAYIFDHVFEIFVKALGFGIKDQLHILLREKALIIRLFFFVVFFVFLLLYLLLLPYPQQPVIINIFLRGYDQICHDHKRYCEKITEYPVKSNSAGNYKSKICGKCHHEHCGYYFVELVLRQLKNIQLVLGKT